MATAVSDLVLGSICSHGCQPWTSLKISSISKSSSSLSVAAVAKFAAAADGGPVLLSSLPAAALAGIELDRDSSLSSGTSTTSNCLFFGGTNRRGLPAALPAAAADFGVSGRGLSEVPKEREAHGIKLQAPNQSTASVRAKRESAARVYASAKPSWCPIEG